MNFPQEEKKVFVFWKKNKIFEKSLEKRKKGPQFTFYDGPPFANGLPHYGHLLVTAIKDLFLRYKTMRGFYVPRRAGWDCHGLPVETEVEKKLKISGKKEIEKYGIEKFNQKAKESVFRYKDEWVKSIERMGRWADFKNAYKTLDPEYIETVWRVFSEIYKKGLIYKGYSVQPYCPRCETPLSNFEVNLGYKDTEDPSIYIKFKIKNEKFKNSYFLVWTTTPWTLPGNVALAVNPDFEYGVYEKDGERLILATKLSKVLNGQYTAVGRLKGKDLVGLKYKSLYPYSDANGETYKVYPAGFVDGEEGTGIVHIAPAFGDVDFELTKTHIPSLVSHIPITVNGEGKIITPGYKWDGMFVKEADEEIIEDLKEKKLLFKEERIVHTYPFCWRCDTPLIYLATSSWFIAVSKVKDKLVGYNKKINWVPAHLKEGRFGKWLEGARDWNISRNRFWGAPIPIWECEKCKERKIVSSLEELNTGKDFDPHRPQIDEIEFTCPKCQGKMKRTIEVFDCWFESGSMPHFEKNFPADFIAEGLDQTRGWFYTLHVIATIVKNSPAFKNVVVNGLVLAESGEKLSKRLRNYPEPEEIFSTLGADALRQFLYSSSSIGEDYRFSHQAVKEEVRKVLLPLWNVYLYFEQYAKDFDKEKATLLDSKEVLDQWILARLYETEKTITKLLDQYELTPASREVENFIMDLSLWYLRRSRKRTDKPFSETLYYVLKEFSKLLAPFMPFLAETLWQKLKNKTEPESIHLADWPEIPHQFENRELIKQMEEIREFVFLGQALRKEEETKVRQPLASLWYEFGKEKFSEHLEKLLLEELNVKNIVWQKVKGMKEKTKGETKIALDFKLTPELEEEGTLRELVRTLQNKRKELALSPQDKASLFYQGTAQLEKLIEKHKKEIQTLVNLKEISKNEKAHEEVFEGKLKITLSK